MLVTTMTFCEACELNKKRSDFPRRRSQSRMRRCRDCVAAKFFGYVCCCCCGLMKESTSFHSNQRQYPKIMWQCKTCVATHWQRTHYYNVEGCSPQVAGASIGADTTSTSSWAASPPQQAPSIAASKSWISPQQEVKAQKVQALSVAKDAVRTSSESPRSVVVELRDCSPSYDENHYYCDSTPQATLVSGYASPKRSSIDDLRDKVHVSFDENGLVSLSLESRDDE